MRTTCSTQSLALLSSVLFFAACGDDTSSNRADARPRTDAAPQIDADPSLPDAEPGTPDAEPGTPDAAPTPDAPPAGDTQLLLSEVRTVGGDEFIEIYNPGSAAVDLTNYYLTDMNLYWKLPAHVDGNDPITVDNSDFLSRFPAGASIAAGGTVVIVADAVLFETAYPALLANYFTLQEDNGSSTEMLHIAQGAAPNPGITNGGEMVALFFWDGDTDLVQDVDIVIAGNAPSAANTLVAKAPVDGPDGGTDTTAYQTDALTLPDFESDTDSNVALLQSYKRVALEGANETDTGGNGILGHDETSEATRTTWDNNAASAYAAATPGATDL